jgi:EAL domain-containing protein (putative c-di-GMP-specific phosphodiesterase class I)
MGIDLGEWVLESALRQMTAWRADGLDIPVSVNVSALQLQEPGFSQGLAALLLRYPGVRSEHLELEVLETTGMNDVATVAGVMAACINTGVQFALDDFGTGYSSLTYLKALPAETLKIDQSFVRDMLTDADDLAIVKGVIGLAQAFKRNVIAEGVETLAHGELLLTLGCNLAQGYGIARPMPAEQVPAWVAHWQSVHAPAHVAVLN